MMIGLIYRYHLLLTEQASTDANAYRQGIRVTFLFWKKKFSIQLI